MKNKTSAVKVMPQQDDESITELMQKLLLKIGEDPERPGLVRTPQRADKALRFLTSGYDTDIQSIVNGALFEEKCDEMVVVKDIEFYSMCEHHLLPFFGTMHVAYLPNNRLIGLKQNSAYRGHVRAPSAIAGTLDSPGGRDAQRSAAPQGRRRDLRSPPLLHDDARG